MSIFSPQRKKKVIDLKKLEKLASHLECDIDDFFEWTGMAPTDFMQDLSSTVGFNLDEFLSKDINELDFKNIVSGYELLKKTRQSALQHHSDHREYKGTIALIINNENHHLVRVKRIIENHGFAIDIFLNPEIALENISKNSYKYIAIITSYLFQEKSTNGIDFLLKLKSKGFFNIKQRAILIFGTNTNDFYKTCTLAGLDEDDFILLHENQYEIAQYLKIISLSR